MNAQWRRGSRRIDKPRFEKSALPHHRDAEQPTDAIGDGGNQQTDAEHARAAQQRAARGEDR